MVSSFMKFNGSRGGQRKSNGFMGTEDLSFSPLLSEKEVPSHNFAAWETLPGFVSEDSNKVVFNQSRAKQNKKVMQIGYPAPSKSLMVEKSSNRTVTREAARKIRNPTKIPQLKANRMDSVRRNRAVDVLARTRGKNKAKESKSSNRTGPLQESARKNYCKITNNNNNKPEENATNSNWASWGFNNENFVERDIQESSEYKERAASPHIKTVLSSKYSNHKRSPIVRPVVSVESGLSVESRETWSEVQTRNTSRQSAAFPNSMTQMPNPDKRVEVFIGINPKVSEESAIFDETKSTKEKRGGGIEKEIRQGGNENDFRFSKRESRNDDIGNHGSKRTMISTKRSEGSTNYDRSELLNLLLDRTPIHANAKRNNSILVPLAEREETREGKMTASKEIPVIISDSLEENQALPSLEMPAQSCTVALHHSFRKSEKTGCCQVNPDSEPAIKNEKQQQLIYLPTKMSNSLLDTASEISTCTSMNSMSVSMGSGSLQDTIVNTRSFNKVSTLTNPSDAKRPVNLIDEWETAKALFLAEDLNNKQNCARNPESEPVGATMEEIEMLNTFLEIAEPNIQKSQPNKKDREVIHSAALKANLPVTFINRMLDQIAGAVKGDDQSIGIGKNSGSNETDQTIKSSMSGTTRVTFTKDTESIGYQALYKSRETPENETNEASGCFGDLKSSFWVESGLAGDNLLRESVVAVVSSDGNSFG